MKENDFVFADLSTYDTEVAKGFYSNIFGWTFHSDAGYSLAEHKGKEVCGLYETPQKFKDMKMPSFWMSYIQVRNVEATVEKARQLGGIIELVDPNQAIGKIALIRDPLGAGFTIYEGNKLNTRNDNVANMLVWNELFVSDLSKVKPFYEGVFNWKLEATEGGRNFILNSKKQKIGAIQELSNEIKGKKEYWAVFFGVEDVAKTKEAVIAGGGSLVYEDESTVILADPFDAFFHVAPVDNVGKALALEKTGGSFKWKAILGISLVLVSLITNWMWIWGLFFAFWVFSDIRSGYTHLFEPVSKKEAPTLYWLIVIMWAFLGAYSMIYYMYPEWFLS